MPDIFINLHSPRADEEEFVEIIPELRSLVEDGLCADKGAAVVQISRPTWSAGYDDVDIQVFASPNPATAGQSGEVAKQIASLITDHLATRKSNVRSVGASVRIFAESTFVVSEVGTGPGR